MMIRVALPAHLRTLSNLEGNEVDIEVDAPVTIGRAVDALEERYPMLRGTIRDHGTKQRRPFIRYFADGQDLSLENPASTVLPATVLSRAEPLFVVGAIAGG